MSYKEFKSKVHSWVSIYLTPGPNEYAIINAEYLKLTGTDNRWEHSEIYTQLVKQHTEFLNYTNMSLEQADIIAEPIRIAYPNRNLSIATSDTSFIGHVTWDDQMEMFFEYPTYTNYGSSLAKQRQEEAKKLGIKATWE